MGFLRLHPFRFFILLLCSCGAMASTMAIMVRYFGTTKKKLGERLRYFSARVDKNGELDLDIGGLREKICSLCHLPQGADITLTYIDEDVDVVTLVDDDDLRDAMRQHLKSFRIDVWMNDDEDHAEFSSSNKSQVRDAGNVTSDVEMLVPPYPDYYFGLNDLPADSNDTKKATTSSVPASYCPTMACFETNQSEALGGMMCHAGFRCGVCRCDPILGSRFKSKRIEDYSLCRKCFTGWGNGTDYIRIDFPVTHRRPPSLKWVV